VRVLALSDSLAPWHSFWIRFGQYAEALPWPVAIRGDAEAIDGLVAGDRLIVYRYALGWGDLAARLREARQRGVIILSDLDDYLWQANGWSRERLLGCTWALRHCHTISCSTQALLEQLQVMFPAVPMVLLPNTAPRLPPLPPLQRAQPPLRIGWTGAPWTRPADLALLRPLAAWIAERPHLVRLIHVGHGEGRLSFAEAVGLPPSHVATQPLQGHANYLNNLKFEIGLAPLAASSFNHYKSAIKLMEYSALGIPWIASDAQPYRELCKAWGWAGALARSDNDWITLLQPLLHEHQRLQRGAELRQLCQRHASHESGVEGWINLLRR
jgi:hypothetical protein